ncbi:hypothetical protein [Microseira wollei]|uniref:Uncharacterized protein n=1 Tax=Microseira wollei NIES-4236 TaxID=2530354 RepID=A0AAV3XEA6_9CYAN|nr:hypothetical protein [Microseira wollei]GET41267.1 hypothetical protein MiSe_60790 [Microseira wollei NIES-4236]
MENQNHESKFEGTPEIESLNIADLELLYKKLEDEDAELYNGGRGIQYNNFSIMKDVTWSVRESLLGNIYGSLCPYAFSDCPALERCTNNEQSCRQLVYCENNRYRDDGCPDNMPCRSLKECQGNYGLQ